MASINKRVKKMQEVGTRVYYGEPINGIGIGFSGKDKYAEFMNYVNYQCTCLRNENIDIKDEEFQGVPFTLSMKSTILLMADMGTMDAIPQKAKVFTVKTQYGVKLLITIK